MCFQILQSEKSRNYLFQNTSGVSSGHQDNWCEFTCCTQDKTANLSLEIKSQLKSQHGGFGACLGDQSNEALLSDLCCLSSGWDLSGAFREPKAVSSQEITALSEPWRDLTPVQAPCSTCPCSTAVSRLRAGHFLLTQMSARRPFPPAPAQLLPGQSGSPSLCRQTDRQTGSKHLQRAALVVPQTAPGGTDGVSLQ